MWPGGARIDAATTTTVELSAMWSSFTDNQENRQNWVNFLFPLLSLFIAGGTLVSGWLSDFVTQKVPQQCPSGSRRSVLRCSRHHDHRCRRRCHLA